MPLPKDPNTFVDTMADVLRLPDATLALAYIYQNKYHRFFKTTSSPDLLDPYVCLPPPCRCAIS